jgi:outer membrane protein, multidrug efflux system
MRPQAVLAPLMLVLTGCAAVGPRYAPPAVAVPAALRDAPADATDGSPETLERWWANFHDPTLDRLVDRALAGNLDLEIAAARIREARAARGIAAAAGLPQVDASAAYARSQRSEAVPPFKDAAGAASPFGAREQNLFQAGFDAIWEIDVFGGVRRDKEAALAQMEAAEASLRDVRVTLLADVARSYMELRGAQGQLAILEHTLATQQDTLDLVRARTAAGLASDLDVARAEGLLATTSAQRPLLIRVAGEAIHRLGVLVGEGPDTLADELAGPAPIPPAPPQLPAAIPSELLSRRPDLRRAERELAAATARIGVARADLFPRFSIAGSFGRLSDEAGDLGSSASQFWSFIPGIRWPILSGGRIRANIRVQDARQQQAGQQYDKAVLVALQEVADALLALSRERERQASLRAAADANRRALEVSLDRYTTGVENFLSVLDAQRSVYAAEDAVVQSERTLSISTIAIYKALGGGWAAEDAAGQPQ